MAKVMGVHQHTLYPAFSLSLLLRGCLLRMGFSVNTVVTAQGKPRVLHFIS